MIWRNLCAFLALTCGMSLFVFIWLALDHFTKGI